MSDSLARALEIAVLTGGRVRCPECRQVEPLVLDRLAPGVWDVVCGACGAVIATLHQTEV